MNVQTTQKAQSGERQTKLSLLLGMVIWFLHLNTLDALDSLACKWDWLSFTIAGIPGLQVVQAFITLIAMLLMLVTIYLPWRDWRRYQTEKPAKNPRMLQDTEEDPRPLIAFIAMLLNSAFVLFIIASFVPIFSLNACGPG